MKEYLFCRCVPVTLDHEGAISAFAVLTVGACGVFGVLGKPEYCGLSLNSLELPFKEPQLRFSSLEVKWLS